MIVIIDYGCGNLLSLKRALDEFKFKSEVSKDKSKILNADLLILPGVGAFENAIKLLKKNDLIDTIMNFTIKKQTFNRYLFRNANSFYKKVLKWANIMD